MVLVSLGIQVIVEVRRTLVSVMMRRMMMWKRMKRMSLTKVKGELMNMLTMNHSLISDCCTEWSTVWEVVVGRCCWCPWRTLTDNIVVRWMQSGPGPGLPMRRRTVGDMRVSTRVFVRPCVPAITCIRAIFICSKFFATSGCKFK